MWISSCSLYTLCICKAHADKDDDDDDDDNNKARRPRGDENKIICGERIRYVEHQGAVSLNI